MDHRSAQDARARAIMQPTLAHLELTYACNWRCSFCFNPRHNDLRGMSLDDWTLILDDLRTLGVLHLTISGGEPLAHPRALDILKAARERRFAFTLFTNGSLVDESKATQIAALFPFSVEISIHGADGVTHDAATNRAGSFERSLNGARLLRDAGVRVKLKSLLTAANEHQLDAMFALAAGEGFPFQVDVTISPRDDGDLAPLKHRASPAAIRRAIELGIRSGSLEEKQRVAGRSNCALGTSTVAIDPEGNVFPCHEWRHRSMGNVRGTRLTEMWRDSDVRIEAANAAIEANDSMLARGGDAAKLPFCPARAFQRTGSATTPDPDLLMRAAIASEVRRELNGSV